MGLAAQTMDELRALPQPSLEQPAVHPRTRLLALLERVEAMPDDATGALMLGCRSKPVGTVLVERGRICWAVTPHLGRRLTDLLVERSAHPLERALFETMFRRCRREGRPLGETLVAAEMVTKERFREALLLHTGEALWRMSEVDAHTVDWIPHRAAKYAADFSFSPEEAMCGAGRAAAHVAGPTFCEDASETYGGYLKACVFADTGDDDAGLMPIAVAGTASLAARELVALGSGARAALGSEFAVKAGVHTQAFVGPGGATVVAYRETHRIVVVLCDDAGAAARVFARRVGRG